MLCWLKSLLAGHHDSYAQVRLELTGDGLALVTWPGPRVLQDMHWNEVVAVRAMKCQGAPEAVCVCFEQMDGALLSADESMEGFAEVLERMTEVFPEIADGWFSDVASAGEGTCDRILIDHRRTALVA